MVYKDILIINEKSNIGISTLWSKKEGILNLLSEKTREKVGIIGTTYTSFGINYMIETLAQNPQINILILYGADLSTSGNALVEIFRNKDKETLEKYNIIFPYENIKEILNTVKVIDLRESFKKKDLDSLIRTIEENYKPGIYRKLIDIKVEEKSDLKSWPIPLSGHYIYETSVFRAWIKILDLITKFGYLKFTEYEEPSKEYLNIVVTIGLYGKKYEIEKEFFEFINKEEFEKHIGEVMSPKKPDNVEYTYGERLFNHPYGGNQIEYIIEKLSKVPYSRRAVAITWDFIKDKNNSNPPCILYVHGIISGNYYNHTVLIRSNDMVKGWPVNIIGQIKLAEYIVNEINKRTGADFSIGTVSTISVSAHIYQHDFKLVDEILSKYHYKLREFIEDPKGNFLIYHENGKVVVEHRTPDHSIITFKESSDNFHEIYNKLKGGIYFSLADHALYLGKELKKAFDKLKRGEKYIQDEA
mgnify:FL=1